ncbi:MAG: MMPL family transporter [Syntrophobacteraceae bacterium]
MALLYATTFLPALLAVLGPRVDAGRVPFLNIERRGRTGRFWHSLSTTIMAHPWKVLLPTALFLIVLGLPFLHIKLGSTGTEELPKTAEARKGWEQLKNDFQKPDTNPIVVVVRYAEGPPLSPGRVGRLYDLSRWLAKLPAVNGVASIVDLSPAIDRNRYVELLGGPIDRLPEKMQFALKRMVGNHIVILTAKTSLPASGMEARDLVKTIETSHPPVDGELMVTGESALQLDLLEAIRGNYPSVVGLVLCVTYVVLFLLLGSLLLPLKAVVLNLLSITASYGALVWVFQEGHLARWLDFTPGPIEAMTPIMMFCILFGLSMDYEVLLLGRIRGEYMCTGDNTEAVALGLERTGRSITGAAAIMAVVLFGFGFSELVVVKVIGIGMGIAIVMDATIVRCLLVPATMRLLGNWNWWAPRPMARVYKLVSLGERCRYG